MITTTQQELYVSRFEKAMERVGERILSGAAKLDASMRLCQQPVSYSKRLDSGEYVPVHEGDVWGREWESAWFVLKGVVPAAARGCKVVARLDFNGEALVFDRQGVPVQGLTNGSVFKAHFARDIYPLFESAKGGEEVELWVEAAANQLFGINREQDPPRNCPERHGTYEGRINHMQLHVFNQELWHLWLDMQVLFGVLKSQPETSVRYRRIMQGMNQAIECFQDNPDNAAACREVLQPLLAQPANASAVKNISVGHAHIDTGWLWPVRETVRKSARTFSSQIMLLNEYPEYVFGASQPQHYAMVKEHYPELYAKIKQAVADGRWECQGAMWVEADCNIISGESMVRQILHGKNFFMDEFGVDVQNMWIPDVFGYSAAMPQIMQRAGVRYFLTQKLSWSQFNDFPYTTFLWQGIDGSRVITHFPPQNSYNSMLDPEGLRKAEENFRESGVLDEMMCLFGVGDGGGGPTRRNIEFGRRQQNLEGVPRVEFGRADEFFERLEQHADELPLWVGELYLELHRGTLTTQARTKRGNRKLELKLRETEFILSLLPLDKYPLAAMDRLWKTLLINQFHDILPGSSIHMVYEQTEKEYADALAACGKLAGEAATAVFQPDPQSLLLINTLGSDFSGPLVLPDGWDTGLVDEAGGEIPMQQEENGVVVAAVMIPAQSMVSLRKGKGAVLPAPAPADRLVLENDLVRYEFAENSELIRAYDKQEEREILEPGGRGNVLTLYDDHPHNWDAWDIDIYYEGMAMQTAVSSEVEHMGNGPVRQGVRFTLKIGDSILKQEATLAANSRRLDFHTWVDWRERHRMLRVAFPTSISSERASFEIQYGYTQRNTHRNTSWDMAKFEVAAHRWVDLSDHDYGVALLNDCKYGHKVHGNVIDLNLLRATTQPDPDADLGSHEFIYSLLPHAGSLLESDVQAQAAQLNQPPCMFPGYQHAGTGFPVKVTGEGVSLEVLKCAEKGGCLVIRVVETRGRRTEAVIETADASREIIETDIMEWNDIRKVGEGQGRVGLKPFEILTFKIR